MRGLVVVGLAIVFLCSCSSIPPAQKTELNPSVVKITARYGYGMSATGYGVIVSTDRTILTSWHVVAPTTSTAPKIFITNNGQTYPAQIIGAYKQNDIALLKSDVACNTPIKIAAARPEYQQSVSAMYEDSIQKGNVLIPIFSHLVHQGNEKYFYRRAFLHNIPAREGLSGAPIINDKKELVGLVSAGCKIDGIAIFVYPELIQQLKTAGIQNGKVPKTPIDALSFLKETARQNHTVKNHPSNHEEIFNIIEQTTNTFRKKWETENGSFLPSHAEEYHNTVNSALQNI